MAVIRRDSHHCDTNMTGQGYQIAATSKAFEALTSNLYTKKPEAVARETLCNADDAHKERDRMYRPLISGYSQSVYANRARKEFNDSVAEERKWFAPHGTPYRVHAPNQIEPWFEVYDNGIGLSVDQVLGEEQYYEETDEHGNVVLTQLLDKHGHPVRGGGMYTTMFASTKELVNDQIGAFGLGAKAGFAISDTFTVECRLNGEKHIYIMFMDDERKPNVTWVTKDQETGKPAPIMTDEYNGVSVRIPVDPEMFGRMKQAIEFTLSTFESDVEVENMWSINKIDRSYPSGQTFIQIKSKDKYHVTTHYAVQGGVAYPIEMNSIRELPMYNILSKIPFDTYTFFNIGELNVPPSREHLTYDKFTMESLNLRTKSLLGGLDRIVIGACINKLNDVKTHSMVSTWKTWESCREQWGDQLTRDRWHAAMEAVFGDKFSSANFSDDSRTPFPTCMRKVKVGVEMQKGEDGVEVEVEVFDERKEPKYDIQQYNYDSYSCRLSHNKGQPRGIGLKNYQNSIIILQNGKRDYVKRTNYIINELCEGTPKIVYLVNTHSDSYFPNKEAKGVDYGIKELARTFENLIPVFDMAKIEMPKTEYSGSVSSGMSRYSYGTSNSHSSWNKIDPKTLSGMLEGEEKYIYVDMTGFEPDKYRITEIEKRQRFLDSIDAGAYNDRIIAIRKSAHRVLKDHGHRFVELDVALKELTAHQVDSKAFRRYAEAQHFMDNVYDNEVFALMAITAPFRGVDVGMFRQFAEPKKSHARRRYKQFSDEFTDLDDSIGFKDRLKSSNRFDTVYSTIIRGRSEEDQRKEFPWLFRLTDFWKPIITEFVESYPMTYKAKARALGSTDSRTIVLKSFEMECFLKEHGYEHGYMIGSLGEQEIHRNHGKICDLWTNNKGVGYYGHARGYINTTINAIMNSVEGE